MKIIPSAALLTIEPPRDPVVKNEQAVEHVVAAPDSFALHAQAPPASVPVAPSVLLANTSPQGLITACVEMGRGVIPDIHLEIWAEVERLRCSNKPHEVTLDLLDRPSRTLSVLLSPSYQTMRKALTDDTPSNAQLAKIRDALLGHIDRALVGETTLRRAQKLGRGFAAYFEQVARITHGVEGSIFGRDADSKVNRRGYDCKDPAIAIDGKVGSGNGFEWNHWLNLVRAIEGAFDKIANVYYPETREMDEDYLLRCAVLLLFPAQVTSAPRKGDGRSMPPARFFAHDIDHANDVLIGYKPKLGEALGLEKTLARLTFARELFAQLDALSDSERRPIVSLLFKRVHESIPGVPFEPRRLAELSPEIARLVARCPNASLAIHDGLRSDRAYWPE